MIKERDDVAEFHIDFHRGLKNHTVATEEMIKEHHFLEVDLKKLMQNDEGELCSSVFHTYMVADEKEPHFYQIVRN